MRETCIRCEDVAAVGDIGDCGQCHWAVRAEVDEGLRQLAVYLEKWARFAEWCVADEARP